MPCRGRAIRLGSILLLTIREACFTFGASLSPTIAISCFYTCSTQAFHPGINCLSCPSTKGRLMYFIFLSCPTDRRLTVCLHMHGSFNGELPITLSLSSRQSISSVNVQPPHYQMFSPPDTLPWRRRCRHASGRKCLALSSRDLRAEQSGSAVLLWDWMGIVSSRRQWAALPQYFMVLKECHAQELLNMGIQTGVVCTSAL